MGSVSESVNPPVTPLSRLAVPAELLSWSVPLLLSLYFCDASSGWESDIAVIKGLGLFPSPGHGAISTALIAFFQVFPIGSAAFRAKLAACVALGWLLSRYYCYLRSLEEDSASPLPALLCTWLLATGTPFMPEAVSGRFDFLAIALAFFGANSWFQQGYGDKRHAARTGLLFGLALAEDWRSSLPIALALSLPFWSFRGSPTKKISEASALPFGTLAGFAAFPLVLSGSLALFRPYAENPTLNLGARIGANLSSENLSMVADPWLGTMPLLMLGGLLGWGLVLLQRKKVNLYPLLIAAGALLLMRFIGLGSLLGGWLQWIAVIGIFYLATGVTSLVAVAKGFGAALRSVFAISGLVLLFMRGAECASLIEQRNSTTLSVLTRESLERLPPKSILLLSEPSSLVRSWAAQLGEGKRPDVLVVPLSLLGSGQIAAQLLRAEPALAPLIRTIAVKGELNELSLSALADHRPLYIEWRTLPNQEITKHLLPGVLWGRFALHSVEKEELNDAVEATVKSWQLLAQSLGAAQRIDEKTALALSQASLRHQLILMQMGKPAEAAKLTESGLISFFPPRLQELQASLPKLTGPELSNAFAQVMNSSDAPSPSK